MRPADMIYPDRTNAATEQRCVKPPIGCGKPAIYFRDDLSRREYSISYLCQECQDDFFFGVEDSDAEDDWGDFDLDMGLPPEDHS